jgi:tetratricopeptide (TPR) repeat protein
VNLIFIQNQDSNKEVKDDMSSEYEHIDIKVQQVEQLIHKGKIAEANHILELLEEKKDISQSHQLNCNLLKGQINIKEGFFEEGLRLAKNALKKSQELSIPLLEIDACITVAKALWGLNNLDEILDVIDQGSHLMEKVKGEPTKVIFQRKATLLYLRGQYLKGKEDLDQAMTLFLESLALREELGDKLLIAESLTSIGQIYSIKGSKNKALEHFKKALTLLRKVGNDREIGLSFWNIGSIYCHKGRVDKSMEYFKHSKNHFEKAGDKKGKGQVLYCLSAMTHDKGELDSALEYQRESLGFYKELGNKLEIAKSLTKIGFIYISKGELDRALKFQNQSLAIYNEVDQFKKSWTLVGIGEIYRLKGELDRALTYLEQSLAIRKVSGQNEDIAESLHYIGKIFQQQGKLDPAWEYFEESLTYLNEPDDNLFISGILLDLVSFVNHKRYYEQSDEYLHRLKKIKDQEENAIINQRYRMAKALFLKTSSRIRDKALVQEMFQKISEEDIVDHRITVVAMYNLCESLVDELKAYGDQSVMLEAKSLAKKLTKLAHKQTSPLLEIDALIMQAKLTMVEGNLIKAEEFLDQAKNTSEDKNLGSYIISKVSTERKNLEDQYEAWQRLIKDKAPFKDRLEQAQLETYLTDALKLARVGKDHKPCE